MIMWDFIQQKTQEVSSLEALPHQTLLHQISIYSNLYKILSMVKKFIHNLKFEIALNSLLFLKTKFEGTEKKLVTRWEKIISNEGDNFYKQ